MIYKLFRVAFFSSPILAIYGTSPFYIFNKVDFSVFISTTTVLSVLFFLFWCVNILLIAKLKKIQNWTHYLLSFFLTFTLNGLLVLFGNVVAEKPAIEVNVFFPILQVLAVNTIILIMSNAIVLQFQKENAEIEIQRLKLNSLEAQKRILLQQLQPHFLFNALSTLKSLISESPNKAEDYTIKLSEFLRYSVQNNDSEIVMLSDELKFTNDYLNLQRARFGEALQCEINIPEAILEKKIPVYALQTVVENAIKHNAFTDKRPLRIEIKYELTQLKVLNNKIPKKIVDHLGMGLSNLQKRYSLLSDQNIQIENKEHEFIVSLSLL